MDETITYGVFWRSRWNPDKFLPFMSWCTTYDGAYELYKDVQDNPACLEVRIIERCEHFEIVAAKVVEP